MQAELPRIRVLLAEDDAVLREAIADLIAAEASFELVGAVADADQAIAMARRHRPDVALLDVKMPRGGGPRAARGIRSSCPRTQVVALSAHDDRGTVLEMIRAGAVGYLVKGVPGEEIVAAIQRSVRGEASLSAEVTGGVIHELATRIERDDREEAERVSRATLIRHVIDSDGIDMVFQPIVELTDRHTVGMEALARFSAEPAQTPDVWFSQAQAVGLGVELELAAVRAALRSFDRLPPDVYVSLNASPETIMAPRFIEALRPVPSDRVVVEITEHARVDDYDALATGLRDLREGGARLAIDDVGAGFASLRHILRLAPDILKLDLTLTRDIDTDHARRALASALILFAGEIGATVVAEGIETEPELQALRSLGVCYGQGYYLARPAPLPDPS